MKPKVLNNGLIISDGFRFVGSIVIDGGFITRVDIGRTFPPRTTKYMTARENSYSPA